MSKGIIARYECPSCANIIQKSSTIVATKTSNKFTFDGPEKCTSCGFKGKMELLTFIPATVTIIPDKEE